MTAKDTIHLRTVMSPNPDDNKETKEKKDEVLPLRVTRSAVTSELSQLESFSPHILEASLRNTSWESLMRDFFRTNSPRFEGFRQTLASGGDFDVQMMSVYNDYMQAIDAVIRNQIKIIGVTEEKLVEATQAGASRDDPVALQLVAYLEERSDFIEFGKMMEDKYHEEYVVVELFEATVSHCRVLWDIENIGVKRKIGGLETVKRIQNFLGAKGLFGSGIDCRITAFFNPSSGSKQISKKVVNELDKAAVEIVWVSDKREDADRKLGNRISQEMHVLKPDETCFVIITSDQDFRHHFQQLHGKGYSVLVVHNAREISRWSAAMEMFCTACYHWNEVLSSTGDDASAAARGSTRTNIGFDKISIENLTSHHETDTTISNKSNHKSEKKNKNTKGLVNSEVEINDFMLNVQKLWFRGACNKWKGTFGFVKCSYC